MKSIPNSHIHWLTVFFNPSENMTKNSNLGKKLKMIILTLDLTHNLGNMNKSHPYAQNA